MKCKRNKKWLLIWNRHIKRMMEECSKMEWLQQLCSINQITRMVARFKYKTWRICISPIPFTSRASLSNNLNSNTKQRYFKVSNNKMEIRQRFSYKLQLMKSFQREVVSQFRSRLLRIRVLIETMNCVLRMILDHNP